MAEFGNSLGENMQYEFDKLLANALADWPVEINMRNIQSSGSDSVRYTVKGLGVMSDAISERYIGKAEEVIFRSLHQSIYTALHGAASYVISLKTSSLRPDGIRTRFENHLKAGMSNADIGYSEEDIAVCKAYFDANKI
jgi:hypothetical protein